jgi:uncharacterized protein with FMN-binding domain
MRRALLTVGGTVAGLAALLSFKTHPLAGPDAAATAPTAPASTSQAMASGPASSPASPAAQAGQGGHSAAAPKASASSPATVKTVAGTVDNTQYGPMQVQLTLSGTKITKVTVLQRTDDGAESDEIDANAIPRLTSETLAAQSAKVDAVSGASYTSAGYIQSLQSALDMAE